jgi:hypothetical protein
MLTAKQAFELGNNKKKLEMERIESLIVQMLERKIEPKIKSNSSELRCDFRWQDFSDIIEQKDLYHCLNVLKEQLVELGYNVSISGNRTNPIDAFMTVKWDEVSYR